MIKAHRLYADRYCADGVISNGWRTVRKGGRVKFGAQWYINENLQHIVGEFVHVQMDDYWQIEVQILRGRIGCMKWFCNAKEEKV